MHCICGKNVQVQVIAQDFNRELKISTVSTIAMLKQFSLLKQFGSAGK